MNKGILVIDDEENLRKLLSRIIELEGYLVFQSANAKSALKLLERESIAVVLCDVKLPDANGIELTTKIKSLYPDTEIIVLTAYGTIEDGVKAMKNGAFDYLTKGEHQEKLIPLLAKATEKFTLRQKISHLEDKLTRKFSFDQVLGAAPSIRHAIEMASKVSVTDTTVLLTGETGTGKEVFARAIHYQSSRKTKSFVAVNCSALGRDILESELFGYKEGAFTGATHNKSGLFQEANEGTLFLDEIGEMTFDLQAKLLRVLESGTFIRVGDTKETKVNIRLIAATNRNLEEEVSKGHFREDLFYRLSVFSILLPPLRERKDDIRLLADFFVKHFSVKVNKRVDGMSAEFMEALMRHTWKGNIRELKNVIERTVILSDDETLGASSLPYDFNADASSDKTLDLSSVEKAHIIKVLSLTQGNKTQAAKLLDIGLTTLYQKIKDYHIS